MLLYRLETNDGLGVYRGSDWENSAWYKATNDGSHALQKLPDEEGLYMNILGLKGTRFAWHTVKLYLQWVDKLEWREAFEKMKVKLCVYEVPDHLVITRSCQCVFNIDNAKLVEKLSPLHFD